jgi:hypothetical protein
LGRSPFEYFIKNTPAVAISPESALNITEN